MLRNSSLVSHFHSVFVLVQTGVWASALRGELHLISFPLLLCLLELIVWISWGVLLWISFVLCLCLVLVGCVIDVKRCMRGFLCQLWSFPVQTLDFVLLICLWVLERRQRTWCCCRTFSSYLLGVDICHLFSEGFLTFLFHCTQCHELLSCLCSSSLRCDSSYTTPEVHLCALVNKWLHHTLRSL